MSVHSVELAFCLASSCRVDELTNEKRVGQAFASTAALKCSGIRSAVEIMLGDSGYRRMGRTLF